jgi:hypothetical protein
LLVAATVSLFAVVGQIRGWLTDSPAPLDQFRAVFLAVVALGYSVGLTTLVLTRSRPLSPVMTYLTAGAYWMYFIHHLLCGAVHLTLDRFDWPIATKFAVTFSVVTAMCVASYHFLIRNRWPEVILNGRKSTPERPPISISEETVPTKEPVEIPDRRAA